MLFKSLNIFFDFCSTKLGLADNEFNNEVNNLQ